MTASDGGIIEHSLDLYVHFHAGQCLNFNCSWVLVLMLRRSLTRLRATALGAALPLDHHVYLHKLTGVVLLLLGLVHSVMHLCNFSESLCSCNFLLLVQVF